MNIVEKTLLKFKEKYLNKYAADVLKYSCIIEIDQNNNNFKKFRLVSKFSPKGFFIEIEIDAEENALEAFSLILKDSFSQKVTFLNVFYFIINYNK